MRDDLAAAAELSEEALATARELDDPRALSAALNGLGEVRSLQGDHEGALACYEESVALRRGLGDPLLIADALYNLGASAARSGDSDRARAASEESLEIARELGETIHVASALFTLAELDLLEGDLGSSEREITESLVIFTGLENDRARAGCLVILGGVAAARGEPQEAALLLGAAARLRGDSPPNAFELPILERFLPELEAALGADELSRMMAEGARKDIDALAHGVVPVPSEE
jgi:tetratricopeptide (TPR) repeat protein